MPRRGFTLVEMVVSLGLTLIVTAAAHRLITATQRWSRVQVAQLSLQSSVRTGALVAGNELRGLNAVPGGTADQNDILSLAPNGIVYRASRGAGFLCQPPAGSQLRFARNGFSGFRDPQPGRDLVYLFLPGSSADGLEDGWLPLAITAVATGTACPVGIGPGITLTTGSSSWPPEITAGTPVRIVELMELRAYQSEGQWWLGARSVSSGEAIQPLAGPLDEQDGFRLVYLNRTGGATADPGSVAGIRIVLRGVNEELRRTGAAAAFEELTTQVTLRNGPRP
jgi:prepilin-type N-terminal cleavage/methylation domain-containing protein